MPSQSVINVYNQFLKTLAKKQNRGFKYRQNFDNFGEEQLIYCEKISRIFNLYPQLDIETYFEAPLKLDETFFPTLKFYTTYQAIKSYTLWNKQRQNLPPDDPYHIDMIKKSLITIVKYCEEQNIDWDQYIESDKLVPHWLQHLKENTISIYVLMGFQDFRQKLDCIEDDIKELYIGNISDNYQKYRHAFMKSKQARPMVEKGFIACKKFLKQSGTPK